MAKKIFGVYLAKLDAPNSEAHARLELPASPWELHDAMDKVQLQENEELYLEIDDYPDAVTMLLGGELGTAYPSAGERTEEPVKPFALPPANKEMRRVFAYLIKHRGIARDVVAHFAKAGLLYEDAEYHNAVFVGTDTDGVPHHAHKRSANSYGKAFRLNVEGSDPRYSFHYFGTDRSLYVFEAPIDMLSFITLYPENWQRHS